MDIIQILENPTKFNPQLLVLVSKHHSPAHLNIAKGEDSTLVIKINSFPIKCQINKISTNTQNSSSLIDSQIHLMHHTHHLIFK